MQAPKSMREQKLKALVLSLESNANLGDALLVAFGVLFLLLAFPFYPLPLVPFLALIAGAIAYKFAPFGTLTGILLAFPAIAYQSTVFAWLYSLIIAITLFEMFGNWHIISLLEILILAPFAPFPFSYLSGFVFLAMALAAFMVGSKKSIAISVPCVFLVLLLSSLWVTDNNAFMPIRDPDSFYTKADALQKDKPALGFGEIGPSAAGAFGAMLSMETISGVNAGIGKVAENTLQLVVSDTAVVQLVSWVIILYFIGYVPGRIRSKRKQTVAAAALLIVPFTNYLITLAYGLRFDPLVIFYALASIGIIASLEHFGVNLSREKLIMRAEKTKQFGKFGLQDMAASEGAQSLEDVGGYEDVKTELKQAIVVPLTQKELTLTYGIKPPTGVLLFGPPGTGKTMLMRALSKELSYGFYYIKCSDLLSQWYGESLPYDEKIMIEEGGRVRLEKIGKVVEEKIAAKVLSFDETGRAVFAGIKDYIKHQCTSPIYEVRTRTGRRIRVTGYHSLFTLSEAGVEPVLTSQLVPGTSQIAVPPKLELPSESVGKFDFLASLREDELPAFFETDIHWDIVEGITRVQDEEFVYDISVDPCQNFAGGFGGIFAHNSEKNISELFSIARKNSPCIMFFDEIDALAKKRDSYQMDEVAPRVLSIFLEEMDGFKDKSNVIVIGATNQPEALDPAILRPGRFDKIIYMHLPDKKAREAIIKVHLKKLPVSDDIDYAKLATMTERYSGADLKNIVSEAAAFAAREAAGKDVVVPISMRHLKDIVHRVRPSVGLAQLEDYDKFKLDFERRTGKPGEAEEEKKEEAVKWDDVAGLDNVRQALLEAIEIPLLHEDLMKQYKIKPSKGLLMFGPPGCGKTLIVKAAASELSATFLMLSGAELTKKGYENAVRVIKETFNRAREQAPALIFMDEIESIASNRDMFGGNVLAQLLTELDGVKELKNVMLLGATNKPAILDPAILRPGRFDKIIYIPPPDEPARKQIFDLNLATVSKEEGFDTSALAKITEGFSGADIASICQEAKMGMVREKLKGKEPKLTQDAVKKVIKNRRPSITTKMLREYLAFLAEYGERGGSGKYIVREEKEEEGEEGEQSQYR